MWKLQFEYKQGPSTCRTNGAVHASKLLLVLPMPPGVGKSLLKTKVAFNYLMFHIKKIESYQPPI